MIILLVLVVGSLILYFKVHIVSNGATFQDKTALNEMNIIIDTSTVPAKINPIVAIMEAVKTYHPRIFNLDKITVEFQLMTSTAGGHSLSKEPVYIVSFVSNKGWSGPSGGPIGNQNALTLHHEFNTVVDANTGEILYGFEYR
jgi:hypothetical protein